MGSNADRATKKGADKFAQICTVIFRFPSRLFGLDFLRPANQDVVVESFRRINAKVQEDCLAASSPVGVATFLNQ